MQTSSADKTEGFRLLRDTVEDVVKRGRHSRPEGVKPRMQLQGNFDERQLGFSSFTEFLSAAEQAGWIARSIDAGGHTVLSVSGRASSRTPSLPPPDSTTPPARRRLRSDLWNAFVEWREGVTHVYDRERARALALAPDPADDPPGLQALRESLRVGAERALPITPIPIDEQRAWMEAFAKRHAEHPLGEALRRAVASPRPFQAFRRILEADPELPKQFRQQRLGNVAVAVLSWMANNALSFSPWERQAPPSTLVPGKSVGLGAELAQLRGLVHRAVDQMSADELRGLSLPLRYVLSPLGAAEVMEVESDVDRVLDEARERFSSSTVTLVEQSAQDGPKDMVTAVEVAESEAKHVVYVAQTRRRAKASPYKAPGEVLKGLRELDRLAGIYKAGGFEGTLTKLFRDRSTLIFRDRVAEATRKKHKDRYTLSWEGQNRLMDPHLCFGSAGTREECARVYWYIDDATRTWVVGHAGEHLPGAHD
jgi:hypothetical protein